MLLVRIPERQFVSLTLIKIICTRAKCIIQAHILNDVCVLCPATHSDQPTEGVPAWGRLISSRCATPTNARTSTATRGRSSATLGTLALNSTATSTTGCLTNTQTVSAHLQMERGEAVWWRKKLPERRMPVWEWQPLCDDTQWKLSIWMKAKKRKQTILVCFWVLYIGCVLLWSLTSGHPAEYSFELWLRPPIKTRHLFVSLVKSNHLWTLCLLFLHPITDVIWTSQTSSSSILFSIHVSVGTYGQTIRLPMGSHPKLNIQSLFTLLRSFEMNACVSGCQTDPAPKWRCHCCADRY